ncbi:hexapeptide transferase family protein [Bacillus sp. NRRL B-14911]|uniref:Lipoyl-binding domain-containing protein n=1 Tax=Bacillus infantis NRRL B-14911 TaxID=1367477 RepID=U5LF46_9BACI|nr:MULTISPECIES: NeuD/PglB/VioB family sugar acetyltransferase [Bacillus]AGX06489.1 hypothetical protein N288_23250 [Bacillus infantis NRRL B-14911]EAR68580.1 hexapeptide transferase family protein [Bacillus sp. NRRL B-14911]
MVDFFELKVPTLGPNDEFATISEWLIEDDEGIKDGQGIVVVETTKTTIELEAESNGFLYRLVEEGEEVTPGTTIAIITTEKNRDLVEKFKQNQSNESKENQSEIPGDVQLTKKAAALVEKLNISYDQLPKGVILKEVDIYKISEEKKSKATKSQPMNNERTPLNISDHSQKVLIYGGGGHAKMCIDIIRQMHNLSIAGIIDDGLEVGSHVVGVPVLGDKSILDQLYDEGYRLIVIGVGAITNHTLREQIFNLLKDKGFRFPNIIHPKAAIEPSALLGEGNQVMANAVIGSEVKLGSNNIINCGTVVSHDSTIYSNVHLTPGAILAGGVTIRDNTIVGMGTTVYLQVEIGSNVVIQNNCRITRNINDNQYIKDHY